MLDNADVALHVATLTEPMPYFFRNADGDEVLFIHEGAGRIETDFGPLTYETGDYLLVPRGHRLPPGARRRRRASSPSRPSARSSFPEKGMLGQHALFDPAVVRVPTPDEGSTVAPDERGEYELRILRRGDVTRVFYPFVPLNTVGWKGTLTVMQLNVRDIRPVLSDRYHLPPSAHSTFVMRNAVICTFLPRPLENGDPRAMKVPFYHSNIDFDEVLFYHRGQFFSREGIKRRACSPSTRRASTTARSPRPSAARRTSRTPTRSR